MEERLKHSSLNPASVNVFVLLSPVCLLQPACAQLIACVVTQDGDQTTYNISDVPQTWDASCEYSWANATVSHTSQNSVAQCFDCSDLLHFLYFYLISHDECFDLAQQEKCYFSLQINFTSVCILAKPVCQRAEWQGPDTGPPKQRKVIIDVL